MAEPAPGDASLAVTSDVQVGIAGVVGVRVSTTVTVKLQVVPPAPQVTVVVPTGKAEPDGGLQTTEAV
jgi:hypothetical protein